MIIRKLFIMALKRCFLLLMFGGIFYLSNQPSLKILPPLFPYQDKVFHIGAFFLLSVSMIVNRDLYRGGHPAIFLLSIGVVYAVSDEFHQSFVPGRDCSAGDLIADIAGLAIGLLSYFIYLRVHLKKNRERENSS